MSWMARCDELGDRREPVELGNSVGSDVDAALTFKAVHGRVVSDPLDRAGSGTGSSMRAHRAPPRESLARKLIRGKTFTREFHCHRDFPGHIRHGEERWRSPVYRRSNLCPKMI